MLPSNEWTLGPVFIFATAYSEHFSYKLCTLSTGVKGSIYNTSMVIDVTVEQSLSSHDHIKQKVVCLKLSLKV